MKITINLLTIVFFIIPFNDLSSQNETCAEILGFWQSLSGKKDTAHWDFNSDNKLIIVFPKEDYCEVKSTQFFSVKGNRLFITEIDSSKRFELIIKKLDCENLKLKNIRNGTEYGQLIEFIRIKGHRCDFEKASDISIINLPRTKETGQKFAKLIWFYLIFIFGAYVILLKWFLRPIFLKPFMKKWLLSAFFLCIIFYSSTYGIFHTPERNFALFQDGQINPNFTLFPYTIYEGQGDGIYNKDSVEFWITLFIFLSLALIIPISIWSTWKNVISNDSFLSKIIIWLNRLTLVVGLFGIGTAITIVSIISPYSPKNWILLIISYCAYMIVLKKTFWDGVTKIDDILHN